MVTLVVATEHALLIARHNSKWVVEEYLKGSSTRMSRLSILRTPRSVYCGTWGNGLWRSDDAGKSWYPVGSGIAHDEITAVAVSQTEHGVSVRGH